MHGFSLVELAIVLATVGLLFAAVVATRAFIDNARTNEVARDIKSIITAEAIYRSRYGRVPGDDPTAVVRWPGAQNGNGDGDVSGRFNDLPTGDASTLTANGGQGETLNFWWHLRLAGLLQGVPAGTTAASPPRHAYGGFYGVEEGPLGSGGLALCAAGLPGHAAASIDAKIDDGLPASGLVNAVPMGQSGSSAQSLPAYSEAGSDTYLVCVSMRGRATRIAASAPPATADASPSESTPSDGSGDGESTTSADAPGTRSARDWFRRFWNWWGRFHG